MFGYTRQPYNNNESINDRFLGDGLGAKVYGKTYIAGVYSIK